MRILYIENDITGHRVSHLRAFESLSHENYLMIPESPRESTMRWVPYPKQFAENRKFKTYLQFIRYIGDTVRQNRIGLVHFLDADSILRYFGIGLWRIPCPILMTFHKTTCSFLRNLAFRRMFRIARYGVVHTRSSAQYLADLGIKNRVHIEYPMLEPMSQYTVAQAREHFALIQDSFVIGALGSTAAYKRMDVLIEALNRVREPCTLLVAGTVKDYDEDYIRSHLNNEKVTLCLHLRWLEGSEFVDAVQACDVVAMPYDAGFNGASGPLVSGVMHGKLAVGSDHGSLGQIMQDNDLGPTVPAGNPEALAQALDNLIRGEYAFSEGARAYQKDLNVATFLKKYEELYNKINAEKK